MAAWLNTLRLSPARPSGSLLLVASVVHEQLLAGDVGSGASSHWRRDMQVCSQSRRSVTPRRRSSASTWFQSGSLREQSAPQGSARPGLRGGWPCGMPLRTPAGMPRAEAPDGRGRAAFALPFLIDGRSDQHRTDKQGASAKDWRDDIRSVLPGLKR